MNMTPLVLHVPYRGTLLPLRARTVLEIMKGRAPGSPSVTYFSHKTLVHICETFLRKDYQCLQEALQF